MIKKSGAAILGASLLGTDAFAASANPIEASVQQQKGKNAPKKALIIGAHPDDPETGCGGTMAVLKDAGWEVVSVYMTKGEAGIPGKTHDEAAAIRRKEAEDACKVFGVRAVFMSQIDGNSEINKARYDEMKQLIDSEKPDVVITHWPVDSHRDHRNCSCLVYDAWRYLGYPFELFYFEVMSGVQSQHFHPTDYVDITNFVRVKRDASFCHKSQTPETWYDQWHGKMQEFRGMESNCKAAEAFIHLRRKGNDIL